MDKTKVNNLIIKIAGIAFLAYSVITYLSNGINLISMMSGDLSFEINMLPSQVKTAIFMPIIVSIIFTSILFWVSIISLKKKSLKVLTILSVIYTVVDVIVGIVSYTMLKSGYMVQGGVSINYILIILTCALFVAKYILNDKDTQIAQQTQQPTNVAPAATVTSTESVEPAPMAKTEQDSIPSKTVEPAPMEKTTQVATPAQAQPQAQAKKPAPYQITFFDKLSVFFSIFNDKNRTECSFQMTTNNKSFADVVNYIQQNKIGKSLVGKVAKCNDSGYIYTYEYHYDGRSLTGAGGYRVTIQHFGDSITSIKLLMYCAAPQYYVKWNLNKIDELFPDRN